MASVQGIVLGMAGMLLRQKRRVLTPDPIDPAEPAEAGETASGHCDPHPARYFTETEERVFLSAALPFGVFIALATLEYMLLGESLVYGCIP